MPLGNKGASLKQTDNVDFVVLNQYLLGLLYEVLEVLGPHEGHGVISQLCFYVEF